MRPLLSLLISSLLLAGCASSGDPSPNGIWVNQSAIDAARNSGRLHESLLAYGPNLQWQIDTAAGSAQYNNGYQQVDGHLLPGQEPGHWQVQFDREHTESLRRSGAYLLQEAGEFWPQQQFVRSKTPDAGAASFEHALYSSLFGGDWRIVEGPGEGSLVRFSETGEVQGLPGAERFALCLAGDCAAMAGEHDMLWLQGGNQGQNWIFAHEGNQLRLYPAVNQAAADQVPAYQPGAQHWRLKRR